MSNCPLGFSSKDEPLKNYKTLKKSKIQLFLTKNYDKGLMPKKPKIYLDWWESDSKTKHHARFCMPLLMANGVGYDILSPTTFEIEWDGSELHDARVKIIDNSSHGIVDNHSSRGSFTVQTGFVPKTEEGYFIYIKGIPNIRRPFSVMEGLIESWWSPANFGIVCLCNSPGKFLVKKGEPLARMILLHQDAIDVDIEIKDNEFEVPQRKEFIEKRIKETGHILDYFKGLYPNGEKTSHHIRPSIYNKKENINE